MRPGKEIFFCDGSGDQHMNEIIRLEDFRYRPNVPGCDFHAELFYKFMEEDKLVQCPACGDLIKK